MTRSRSVGGWMSRLTLPLLILPTVCGPNNREARRTSGDGVDVLLVSGVHANEICAPIMAQKVHQRLTRLGLRVALFRVPRSYTLLGLLDDPATAMTRYSRPLGTSRLDMDLDSLDGEFKQRYPGALVFEFHNGEDSDRIFGIEPTKPVQKYELGTIGPRFARPYEIGTWRNIDPDGHPSKFLIELPASYVSVGQNRLLRRGSQLERLKAEGYEFEASSAYLEREADVEVSRRKGYLEDCLAQKITGWIVSRQDARHRSCDARPQAP